MLTNPGARKTCFAILKTNAESVMIGACPLSGIQALIDSLTTLPPAATIPGKRIPDIMLATYLIWFIIGLIFIVLEITVPGFILIFFGIGSWTVAAVTFFIHDLGLEYQILIFITASLVGLIALRRLGLKALRGLARETRDNGLDDSAVGTMCVVSKEIAPDAPGTVKYRGSFWRAVAGEHIAAGTLVQVEKVESGREGPTFFVRTTRGYSSSPS